MNISEKVTVRQLRFEGVSYAEISKTLGISENTIKSYCRRNNLGGNLLEKSKEERQSACKQCGKPINLEVKGKPRKFCSEPCRRDWWKTHDKEIKRKAYYALTCVHCGKEFESYGKRDRKYCGHACYINHRFGEVPHDVTGTV